MQEDIKNAVEVLRSGGVLLYPTDTIWGLGCDATNPDAVKKIYAIKNRDDHKALIVLAGSIEQLQEYVVSVPGNVPELLRISERPLTVVYPHSKGLAYNVTGADSSVAVRIPSDPFCQALLEAFGRPVVSTSANISNVPFSGFYQAIDPQIIAAADYVAHHRRGDTTPAQPSRIIRVDKEGQVVVLRE